MGHDYNISKEVIKVMATFVGFIGLFVALFLIF